jgi:hypothetical protein
MSPDRNSIGLWVIVLTHRDPHTGEEIETKRTTSSENVVSNTFDDAFRNPQITAIKVFKPKRGKNG